MVNKILVTLAALILVVLPFLIGNSITKYSPYFGGNSFQTYVIIWVAISIAFVSLLLLVLKYTHQTSERVLIGGVLLVTLLCPIVGIVGLAEAPDLSIKMLDHPEREHLRYIFLFIAAVLFGIFALLLLTSKSLEMNKSTRQIVTIAVVLALIEFVYEFTHHYLYPEGLKEWMDKGNSADDFGKNYDNTNVISIGVAGRLIQYGLIIWLSLYLYKLRQVRLWYPIPAIIFGLAGIASAIIVYITEFNFPKGFEILMLFFIPGMPFIILYWLGIALVTKLFTYKTYRTE